MRVNTIIEFENGTYTEVKKEFDFSFITEDDLNELTFIYSNNNTFDEVVYKYVKSKGFKMFESWNVTGKNETNNLTTYRVCYWTENKPAKWTFNEGIDEVVLTGNNLKNHIKKLIISN